MEGNNRGNNGRRGGVVMMDQVNSDNRGLGGGEGRYEGVDGKGTIRGLGGCDGLCDVDQVKGGWGNG